ncbi:histidine triad (HIT) family protein [Amphibacillus marinus]|uniref:Histidine triad (HIT) family protein n=1 Tax=Amphibacillus marinus TaxID=872970 RepID=A0A1H8RUC7_9BACI|nr:HIT family protein [Amphibacillus marinus]SEO69897.1 histidine triad (HIT) family protein [Amphibacillus marinus]
MSSSTDCIFCKIIQGDIPSAQVYEDEHVYAFLDISQVTKGHTLIIPKQHVTNIYNTDAEIASQLFARVPTIANAIKKAFKPAGLNILSNTDAFAGQSVFHLHIHLLPRYDKNDGFGTKWMTNSDAYNQADLARISKAIADQI